MAGQDPVGALFDEFYSGLSVEQVDAEIENAVPQVNFIVKVLGLTPGQRVLDLGGGYGRHGFTLARRGFDVTVLDRSQISLDMAIQKANEESLGMAEEERLDLKLVRGDMGNLPLQDGSFDAVYSYYTSFGYCVFDAEGKALKANLNEDDKTLKEVFRVLKPGGKFLIDYLNIRRILRNFVSQRHDEYPNRFILKDREFDRDSEILKVKWTFIYIGSGKIEHTIGMKAYDSEDMKALLRGAGFDAELVRYGDIDRELHHDYFSERMIIVAEKPLQ